MGILYPTSLASLIVTLPFPLVSTADKSPSAGRPELGFGAGFETKGINLCPYFFVKPIIKRNWLWRKSYPYFQRGFNIRRN